MAKNEYTLLDFNLGCALYPADPEIFLASSLMSECATQIKNLKRYFEECVEVTEQTNPKGESRNCK